MEERDLIPFEPSEIAAERPLILAAHPDDEVFGAGGWIARAAGRAEAVRVVVFTGGEAQEKVAPGAADPETRRREAREAGTVLGVSDYLFLDMPDRGLDERRKDVAERIRAEIASFRPDAVLAPSLVEIHPDHRAIADALFSVVTSSRPEDADHERYRFLRMIFYEVSSPLLPNALVALGEFAQTKRAAMERFSSQNAVRDYPGAMNGLNAFRSLTLSGAGPAEAFRVMAYSDASRRSMEEVRREIGPGAIAGGSRQVGEVSAVVRTKNRPALLREAVESLARQSARPRRVVVVNDGGASPADVLSPFREAFDVVLVNHEKSVGRSAAANAGAAKVETTAFGFLDDDDVYCADHFERLLSARAAGPEPIVYSDAATVILSRDGEGWKEKHRDLQYSMDFDAEYLLFANYIPLHTVLFDSALYRKVGGIDAKLNYSEDWDLLIRLSFEAPFRHVRAVTALYRFFEGEEGHVPAGGEPFLEARRQILERYSGRWNGETAARALDRLGRRLFTADEKERTVSGELFFQRASHRRLAADLDAERGRLSALEAERQTISARLGEAERQLAEVTASNRSYADIVTKLYAEIARLNALIRQMEETRAWRLHLFVDKFKGKG